MALLGFQGAVFLFSTKQRACNGMEQTYTSYEENFIKTLEDYGV